MPMSDAAVGHQHQQQHLRAARCLSARRREGGGEGLRKQNVREGEADDVKSVQLFRSPLHDM